MVDELNSFFFLFKKASGVLEYKSLSLSPPAFNTLRAVTFKKSNDYTALLFSVIVVVCNNTR